MSANLTEGHTFFPEIWELIQPYIENWKPHKVTTDTASDAVNLLIEQLEDPKNRIAINSHSRFNPNTDLFISYGLFLNQLGKNYCSSRVMISEPELHYICVPYALGQMGVATIILDKYIKTRFPTGVSSPPKNEFQSHMMALSHTASESFCLEDQYGSIEVPSSTLQKIIENRMFHKPGVSVALVWKKN